MIDPHPPAEPEPAVPRAFRSTRARPYSFLVVLLLAPVSMAGCDLILGPNEAPTATIARPAAGAILEAGLPAELVGSGSDPEDGDLTGDALQWTSSVDGSLGSGTTVTVSGLSLGEHEVVLVATDSEGSADTAAVQVVVNALPSAEILQPSDGAVLNEGEQAFFEGSATDPEDGVLTGTSLLWTSDVDGFLGDGVTVRRPGLSAGTHAVTLTATDSRGGTATDSVEIYVNPGPEVTITEPAEGEAFEDGAVIVFRGEAVDEETGALDGSSFVWTSSQDGEFGTGPSVTRSDLRPGLHTITLTATDDRGATGSATIRIIVGVVRLELGEAVTGLGAGRGSQRHFIVEVPGDPDAVRLRFILTGGNGDADLYVRLNGLAGTEEGGFDCSSVLQGNREECVFEPPAAGTWYVLVYGFTAYDGAVLLAELEVPGATCTPDSPDRDGDRLPDCAETGTGVFVDALDTGTDPNERDTDRDGLADGDEVLGTLAGLDLPAFGVSPLRKDILMEYDWVADAKDCEAHTHRPTPAALDLVTAVFASAPVPNPDGTTGIHIVHDYGQGGVFTGGNLVDDSDGVIVGGVNQREYLDHKAANFGLEREGYFHYVLMLHNYNLDSSSSGQAEIGHDDMIVSLQCFYDHTTAVAHTIVHELGHNLGLRHGGDTNLPNYKPNYNSVMNYRYQFPGVDDNCTPPGDGVLDYSYGTRPALDENDLDEPDGICGPGTVGWDWNGDGDTSDLGIQVDINTNSSGEGDERFDVLRDFDDWANLVLTGVNEDADGVAFRKTPEIVSCQPLPESLRWPEGIQ